MYRRKLIRPSIPRVGLDEATPIPAKASGLDEGKNER